MDLYMKKYKLFLYMYTLDLVSISIGASVSKKRTYFLNKISLLVNIKYI